MPYTAIDHYSSTTAVLSRRLAGSKSACLQYMPTAVKFSYTPKQREAHEQNGITSGFPLA